MAVTGNEAVTLDQLKMWGDEKLGEVAGVVGSVSRSLARLTIIIR